jgi:hypothetical protein
MVLRHFKVDDVIAAPLRSRGKARQLILRVTTSLIGVGLQCRNITWPNRATSNVQLDGYVNSVVKSGEEGKNERMNTEHGRQTRTEEN